jgi:transposase
VRSVGIKELARRYGIDRNTVRRALRADEPPRYERPSKLEPFKAEIRELLRAEPKLSRVRIRELIDPLGFQGGKTSLTARLRSRPPTARGAFSPGAKGCVFSRP